MLLKICKIRDVVMPSRAHSTDAGIDFFIPEFNKKFIEDLKEKNSYLVNGNYLDEKYFILPERKNVLIPTGIKVEIPYGYMGLFLNKSGVASKLELVIGAQVIDTFYSGEVHIDIHNVGNQAIKIEPGMKIAQMVLVPISCPEPTLVDEEQLYDFMKQTSFRDGGGFGSSGK